MALSAAQALGALIPVSYLLGSIPFGLLVGWANGIDVRKAGSGNIGATNVGRLLGRQFFFLVFFLDLIKGTVPMVVAANLLPRPANQGLYILCLLVSFAAILGHMFSVFLKFKGGKGVSTSFGVVLGFWPYFTLPAIVAVLVFLIVLFATRYVSLASIIGSISLAAAYVMIGVVRHWHPFTDQLPLLVFIVLVAGMIVVKHRANISRLMAGTESRMKRRSERV